MRSKRHRKIVPQTKLALSNAGPSGLAPCHCSLYGVTLKTLTRIFLLFLVAITIVPALSASEHKPSVFCGYASTGFCLVSSPVIQSVEHEGDDVFTRFVLHRQSFTVGEYGDPPEVHLHEAALWKLSYLRHASKYTLLLEQRIMGKTEWTFIRIGQEPNLTVTFESKSPAEAWYFARSVGAELYGCQILEGSRVCESLQSLKQLIVGHIWKGEKRYRVRPNLRRVFADIVYQCSTEFDKAC